MVNTRGFNPETGEWNDSLTGDFVWGNANIGEALSCVVTPFTWSVIGDAYDNMNVLPGYHIAGNIGGRPYQNGTVMVSALKAIGKDVDAMFREIGGAEEPPQELTIPLIPISWRDRISILFNGIRLQIRERAALRGLRSFLVENPEWCADMRRRTQTARTREAMIGLWSEIEVHAAKAFWCVVSTVWRYAEVVAPLRRELTALVGEGDASALLSSVSTAGELLASLGPVVGLSRVARGELTRQAYLAQYGHRGPYEAEFSAPRPAEDPDWLDRQLDLLAVSAPNAAADAEEMLSRGRSEFEAASERFRQRYPQQADTIMHRLGTAAEVSRAREAVRSELTRQVWAGRAWALRAGELSALGDDIFYFIAAEVLDLLAGKPVPVETIPTRKETYARYRALPSYPPIISGQFDPFAWAADPSRRNDIFDSHVSGLTAPRGAATAQIIKGAPGSAGRVQGRVRRIDSPEEAYQLLPGEILVTGQTNIGWTLLFPRVAAVVTDVGAPLSHAAIVARELGIPAVVGCGDATVRLKTGDQVRVDGGRGVVEILSAAMSSARA
jgi:phosphohistidine swiveling domain-containing protein